MRSSSWTLCADVIGVKDGEPKSQSLEFKVKGSDRTVYFQEVMVDAEDPVDLVEWLRGERFDAPKLEYVATNDSPGKILITFDDLDAALRFKMSFGAIVTVMS